MKNDKLVRLSDVFGKCILVPHLNGAEAVMESDLYDIPVVDAVEVRHGRWEGDYPPATFRLKRCSVCKTLAPEGWYCFFCGACMDEDIKEEKIKI